MKKVPDRDVKRALDLLQQAYNGKVSLILIKMEPKGLFIKEYYTKHKALETLAGLPDT